MSDWTQTTWGELIELKYGKALRGYKDAEGEFPVYGTNGPVGWCDKPLCEFPSIIIGRKGAYRGVHYSDKPFFVIDTAYFVVPKVDLNLKWAYYHLLKQDINSLDSGSAIPSTSREDVYQLTALVPPRAVQDEIVRNLDCLNDKIELNRQINQTLEQIAQAIFKSWFVDFEPVKAKIEAKQNGQDPERATMRAISGKTDEELDQLSPERRQQLTTTAALFPDELEDSELGEIPKGWEVKQIQDLAKTIKGKSYKSAELAESNTVLVTLKSFNRGGGYRLDGLKEYTGKYKPEQEVFAGDLIIAYTDVTQAADVIGKPAMVISDSRYDHLVISLDVAVVRPVVDSHKYFLYGMAKTDIFQQHTRSYTTGTTVLHLGKTAVPEYKFSKPSEDLIEAYKTIVAPMFELINERIEESKNNERLRDLILPKLLSGEIILGETHSRAEAVAI